MQGTQRLIRPKHLKNVTQLLPNKQTLGTKKTRIIKSQV